MIKMTRKYTLCTLLALFCSTTFVLAQDTLSYDSYKQKNQSKTLLTDTITTVNTVSTTVISQDLPKELVQTTIKDSVVFILEDNPDAELIDKKWREELAKMDLFDSINKMRNEQVYQPEVNLELPTDTLKKRLAEINARTPFNVEYNPSLESVINRYLKRHKGSMERLMAVSQFYFPMFEERLDRFDIPLEMKYLAIVESALKPRAKSRVGATGLWQFMFATGEIFDLEVNSYVDDRMDPIAATEAACAYLSQLYNIHGDWDLALKNTDIVQKFRP